MLRRITVRSPSKINVFLEVLGKRADGFHNLETVMLRTQLADTIQFQATESESLRLQLHRGTPAGIARSFPLDDSNLILRAARALREHCGTGLGVEILVAKRIPAESGMGGGSGNAAVTLLALNRLWNLSLPLTELHKLAATLGSDVNFLLSGYRAAICRGRGEFVEQIPIRGRFHFVAIRPQAGNSTAEVFRKLSPVAEIRDSRQVVENLRGGFSEAFAIGLFNRLTERAVSANAELATLMKTAGEKLRVQMFMSGSGSTCLVPVGSHRQAVLLSGRLKMVTGLPTKILWI